MRFLKNCGINSFSGSSEFSTLQNYAFAYIRGRHNKLSTHSLQACILVFFFMWVWKRTIQTTASFCALCTPLDSERELTWFLCSWVKFVSVLGLFREKFILMQTESKDILQVRHLSWDDSVMPRKFCPDIFAAVLSLCPFLTCTSKSVYSCRLEKVKAFYCFDNWTER